MKNKTILVDNKNYKLKKVDMYPHDINWENLNINKAIRILRKILSYILIIIILLFYFLLVIFFSAIRNTLERTFNLQTDCSNVNYENKVFFEIILFL